MSHDASTRYDLRKRPAAAVFILLVFFVGQPLLVQAQDHTGAIQGKVTDKAGNLLDGATAYLSSPTMLGGQMAMTRKSGCFDFPALAPGVYRISVEKPGFRTIVRDQVILRAGMSFFFLFELESSEQEDEGIVTGSPPALDAVSPKRAVVQDPDVIRSIPMAREFGDVLNLAPGVISPGYGFSKQASIHGGTVRDNTYALDGVNLTDIFTKAPLANLGFDTMEEIEIISAGQPASQLPAGGAYVNVVSRSGGNSSAAELGLFAGIDGLHQSLWKYSQTEKLGVTPPVGDKNLFESSLNLGGYFWEDRAWYFLSGRFHWNSVYNNFIGSFRDVQDRLHASYGWSRRDTGGFFKLTVRPISNAKFTAWFNFADVYQPVSEDPSPRLPFLSTHILDHENSYALHGVLDYNLNQYTMAYARAAYVERDIPSLLQEDALNLSWTDDAGDLYGPLSGADYNSKTKRKRTQVNAAFRLFAESFLGRPHTLNLGADFDDSTSNINWWRQDNMLWYLDSRNPRNYFYEDRGLLAFYFCGPAENSTLLAGKSRQLGIYATDTFSLAGRLTFSLGIRFGRSWGWLSPGSKQESGNPLSVFLGDALVSPYLKATYPSFFSDGFNPWGQVTTKELKDFISWNTLSPRAGVVFDVWGNAKTILKAAYARYADDLSHRYFLPLNPLYPQSFAFEWLDANGDGRPDLEDEFRFENLDLRFLPGPLVKNRVADGVKAPYTEEISAGLEQELFKDLTLGLHYISRQQKNILEDVLYVPETGEYWYSLDQAAAQKHWIPFTTTVPGTDSYPARTITFYAKSLQAPPAFLQLRNVPELKRKYRALEFVFHKRMARGWQLGGSLVLSKNEGNIGGFLEETTGLTAAANSPNFFIDRYGRLDTDRPLQIRLYGTIRLPSNFWLSASYRYQSGSPWQRWVQVFPSAAWCVAHNAERAYYTVNLETPGTRREKAWSSLDLRLEKKWPLGQSGKIGFYADVVNLLGSTASFIGLNDIALWKPAAEGEGQPGQKIMRPDYGVTSAVYGRRTLRFGFKLDF